MAQYQAVIKTLKQVLKSHKFTYARVAEGLDMSEANVKRMFSSERFTLERLEAVCQLLGMEMSDLFSIHESMRERTERLSEAQERELVSDLKLLLVAVCVRNRLTFTDIVNHYKLSEHDCIRYLAHLDRIKLIDLLPGNRYKLLISEDFRWLPNGPISRFFEQQIQAQFLNSNFSESGQLRLFQSGPLSERSHQIMMKKIEALGKEFTQLLRDDSGLPLDKRQNAGLLLVLRPWELTAFQPLLR